MSHIYRSIAGRVIAAVCLSLMTCQVATGDDTPLAAPAEGPVNPKLVKLPFAFSGLLMENTPVIYKGRPLLVQNYRPIEPDEQESGSYLFIEDLTTGQKLARFGTGFSFVSAFVRGEEMNIFGTVSTNKEWTKDVYRFWSTDLKTWKQELAIARDGDDHLFNTSVCQDDQGYLMVYESVVPVSWCLHFARSKDLSHWEKIPGLAFADVEGNATCGCPAIRYFAPYYYLIYGAWCWQGPAKGYEYGLPTTKYTTLLARSRDLVTWELSPTRGPMLDPVDGEGINNTDADLFELEGNTYITYATGDQATWGTIRMAMYAGPMKEMFEAYFPEDVPTVKMDAKQHKFIYPQSSEQGPVTTVAPDSSVKLTYGNPGNGDPRVPGEPVKLTEQQERFKDYKVGLFIHFGIYSSPEKFNPQEFDARQWVDIAKSAGMRYIILTSKHHEGFCLFDSKLTDFSCMNSSVKKDLVGELAAECHRQDMPFFIYYSPLDYHHPDFKGKSWPEPAYIEYMNGQLRELATNYGDIAGFWLDVGPSPRPLKYLLSESATLLHQLQPKCLVMGYDFYETERSMNNLGYFNQEDQVESFPMPTPSPDAYPWELCDSINDSYNPVYNPDDKHKTAEELIRYLVEVTGHGGNLALIPVLLDSGLFPDEHLKSLHGMGDWLAKNGESVYGTRPLAVKVPDWGVVVTGKDRIYMHILKWPGTKLHLAGIKANVLSASLLATGSQLNFKQQDDVIEITLPEKASDPVDTIVVLKVPQADDGSLPAEEK